MKPSTAVLALAALLGLSTPCWGQFNLFSTGPLPIYGTRFTVAAPIVSGAAFGVYGYSDRAYGVSYGTGAPARAYGVSYGTGASATDGYGYRVPRARLRRALWIFQPPARVTPQPQDNPTPSPRPTPSADTTTSYVVKYPNENAIARAIEEAAQWPKKTLPPVKATGKPQLWIFTAAIPTPEEAKLIRDTQQYLQEHDYPLSRVRQAGTTAAKDLPSAVAQAITTVGGPPALIITDTNNNLLSKPMRLPSKQEDIIQAITSAEGR